MKRLILLIAVISGLSLIGCGSKEADVAESGADPATANATPATPATPGTPASTTVPEATSSGVQDTPVNSLGDK